MDKQVYDPIHGFITITPLMQKIIDTPEFQRLRDLKQLGAVHYVYPSATHTRFEHSLGVSHLAGIMATKLLKTNAAPIENFVELCRIAGLIHDIGHGPFSHLYDSQVRYHNEPEHEERGCAIFRSMAEKYKFNITDEQLLFIQNMIVPPAGSTHKWYFQIIANKDCQIDVDKIDYILRDCYHTGLKFGGEWSRLYTQCMVHQWSETNSTIIWPKKLEYEILQLFTTRYRLHRQVYSHHTVKAYEYYIAEILKGVKATATRNSIDFMDMTDSIVTCRLHKEWSNIQLKIMRRELPKMIEENIIDYDTFTKRQTNMLPRRILDELIIYSPIGFASGDDNPLKKVLLKTKDNSIVKIDESMSMCMPKHHREIIVRKYKLVTAPDREVNKKYSN